MHVSARKKEVRMVAEPRTNEHINMPCEPEGSFLRTYATNNINAGVCLQRRFRN